MYTTIYKMCNGQLFQDTQSVIVTSKILLQLHIQIHSIFSPSMMLVQEIVQTYKIHREVHFH